MNNKIDLISLEITWNSLKSIADESYITLMKSAFSTNIKEGSIFNFWNWKNILRIERFFKKII